jgi:exosortase
MQQAYPKEECTAPSAARARLWLGIGLAVSIVLTGFIYAHTAADLFDDWWNEPSLSQGLLIPPLALYFAWADRHALLALPAVPNARALIAAAAGCVVYLVGKLGAEFFLQRISLIVILVAIIWLWWGTERLKRLAFPLVLLAAMIPLPAIVYNAITAPLQLFASDVAASLSKFCGVSVYRDGNIIQLAHISLGVDEACSGLNSFSALIVAALLIGRFLCNKLPARVLLVILSAPLAVAVNVVRIAGTAVLADYHEQFALGFYHLFAGWLVFMLGFSALVLIAKTGHHFLES